MPCHRSALLRESCAQAHYSPWSCIYASVAIFALPFVTFTPSSLARATISIRLRAETACAILSSLVSIFPSDLACTVRIGCLLGSVGPVVHEEQVEVAGVVDEEGLVAGGHHVAGLLVAAVANLQSAISVSTACSVDSQIPPHSNHAIFSVLMLNHAVPMPPLPRLSLQVFLPVP